LEPFRGECVMFNWPFKDTSKNNTSDHPIACLSGLIYFVSFKIMKTTDDTNQHSWEGYINIGFHYRYFICN
jgi:hypothetical protein